MNNIIAIDPGSKGFVTFLSSDGEYDFYAIKDGDMLDFSERISKFIDEKDPTRAHTHCIIEEVHAVFGSSAKSTFAFGEINGFIKGFMVAHGVPYTLVAPKIWQSNVWINQDKIFKYGTDKDGKAKKSINTKSTSYNAARRLFPNIDLKRTPKCKSFDDNKVDSLLICEYARRNNL